MKKIIVSFFLFTLSITAQNFKVEDKSITLIYEVKDKNKEELFSKISKWIALNYNSAQNVIQLSDINSGNIIVKGVNSINLPIKALSMFSLGGNPTTITLEYNHITEITVKDGKFRIINHYENKPKEISKNDKYRWVVEYLNFNGIPQEILETERKELEPGLVSAFVGKKKRDLFFGQHYKESNDANNILLESAKKTIMSLVSSTIENDGF